MRGIINVIRGFRQHASIMVIVALALAVSVQSAHARGGGAGLNLGIGLGAQIPDDDDSYGGEGTVFYPELQLMFDIAGVRFGPSVGAAYREVDDLDIAFAPAKFNLEILPIRFARGRYVFHPYLGIGVGRYIAIGDNEDDFDLISFNGGFEFRFSDWYNLSLAFSYHDVDEDDSFVDADLNYATVMLVNRFRIPFWRRY